jgi:hypothetical protein
VGPFKGAIERPVSQTKVMAQKTAAPSYAVAITWSVKASLMLFLLKMFFVFFVVVTYITMFNWSGRHLWSLRGWGPWLKPLLLGLLLEPWMGLRPIVEKKIIRISRAWFG